MIRFDYQGDRWAILFRHDHENGTHCALVREEGPMEVKGEMKMRYKIMAEGFTSLHHTDVGKYNKEVGRKLSLSRALGAFPRGDRRDIWKAYFGRTAGGEGYYVK